MMKRQDRNSYWWLLSRPSHLRNELSFSEMTASNIFETSRVRKLDDNNPRGHPVWALFRPTICLKAAFDQAGRVIPRCYFWSNRRSPFHFSLSASKHPKRKSCIWRSFTRVHHDKWYSSEVTTLNLPFSTV